MLLAIDIGNSTIKAAGFHAPDAPAWVASAATRRETTPDEFEVLLRGLLALHGQSFEDVSGIAAVSVVPDLADALDLVARRRLGPRAALLATSANLPLPIRVDNPREVGADRLVDAYAAHWLHGGPLVVADLGTAITVDAVGRDGGFLGGAIAAGPALALRALADHTAKLPRVPLTVPPLAIGRDTVSALQSGAAFGWRDLVSGLIARVRAELADLDGVSTSGVKTVLTGGFSGATWAKALGADVVDHQLTLKGLAHFYAEVVGAPVEAAL